MRNVIALICGLLLVLPAQLHAKPILEKPKEVEAITKAEKPVGHGIYSYLWMDVYEAALWSESGEWDVNKPFALTIVYNYSIESDDFVDRTIEEMRDIEHLPQRLETIYRKELPQLFPDVKRGDRITAISVPNKGVLFFHNSQPTGMLREIQFSRRFFDIWLSPETSDPELRKALLGT